MIIAVKKKKNLFGYAKNFNNYELKKLVIIVILAIFRAFFINQYDSNGKLLERKSIGLPKTDTTIS